MWWRAAALTLALVSSATAQPADGEPPLAEATVAATLSESERMLVDVRIGGNGPYPFIVDTAAERSVIARELAEELKLKPAGRGRMLSMSSTREAGIYDVPELSYLPGQHRRVQAFAMRGDNIGASGVLGIDALRGQRVVLDFEAKTLRVGPATRLETPEPTGPNVVVVRARRRLGQLVLVDVTVEGVPVDVIVDSGTQASVGNEALRRLLFNRKSKFQPVTLVSITGETIAADYARADRLVLGAALVTGVPIAFANAHFFQRMDLTRRPALLLGMDALQMFARVTVDFPNRRATFVLPRTVS
jgi:predicted aspartyl protease